MLYFIIKCWACINKEIVKFICYLNRASYGCSLHTYALDDTWWQLEVNIVNKRRFVSIESRG